MAEWVRQWESSSWLGQAKDWIDRVLLALGVDRAGEAERVTLGLTATVLRIPTSEGDLYFKASAPPRSHEAELVTRLAPHAGGHIPVPLAVEPDEGWLLSPGLGRPPAPEDLSDPVGLRRIMADAADLQIRIAAAPQDVLAEGGMPGLLPADLPAIIEDALTMHASLPQDDPLHLRPEDAEALFQRMPQVSHAAQLLADSGVPASIQQGELRPEQVLLASSRRVPVMFVGWGEARWAHPFELVGSAVGRLCVRLEAEPDTEPVRGIVDAYLARFDAYGSVDELRELLVPALMLSHAQRHEALLELITAAEPADRLAAAPQVFDHLAQTFGVASLTHHGRRVRENRRRDGEQGAAPRSRAARRRADGA